jgi:hypothetical protein
MKVLPLASPIFNSGSGWCVVLVSQVAFLLGLPRFGPLNRFFGVFHKDTKIPTILHANSWDNFSN